MNKTKSLSIICAFLFLTDIYAQEIGLHNVVKIDGRIVNQQSGNELKHNEQVNMHTMLLFGSVADNAILRSPTQRRYRLATTGELLVSSDRSLKEIKSRPMTDTDIRLTREIPPETLKKYFGTDTFAIIGNVMKIQVGTQNAQNYDLVFRFEENNKTKEVVSNDFIIRQNDFGQTHINDCLILLRQGDKTTEITKVAITFLDEQNLHNEFAAWLSGLEEQTNANYKRRIELQQYCRDVYGVMDHNNMHYTIGRFLENGTR